MIDFNNLIFVVDTVFQQKILAEYLRQCVMTRCENGLVEISTTNPLLLEVLNWRREQILRSAKHLNSTIERIEFQIL